MLPTGRRAGPPSSGQESLISGQGEIAAVCSTTRSRVQRGLRFRVVRRSWLRAMPGVGFIA